MNATPEMRPAHGGLDADQARVCFGKRLREARKRKNPKVSQDTLAEKAGVTRPVIGSWESGKTSPDPDQAVKLAQFLGEDCALFLLLSNLQRAANNAPTIDVGVLEVVNGLLETLGESSFRGRNVAGLSTHLSLLDSCAAFTPMTVIVGDKREEDEPQNAGDLYVFSASTVDDRWVFSLGLPPDTEKISDKVIMTAYDYKMPPGERDNWFREKLGKRHLLCIGSPASNLFTRQYNNEFLFRFAITREAQKKWEKKRDEMYQLETQADLWKFYLDNKADLKHTMRLFKPPGFIDFNYEHLKLGMDISYNKDFAVISLGRNPFAAEGEPFFAILVAGVHHPGTANAVKFLSRPKNFENHPFGGILEIEVPSKACRSGDIRWHNKVENCSAFWHSAGPGADSLRYDPSSLQKELKEWLKSLSDIVTDVEIDEKEIKNHIDLIDQLAAVKARKNPAQGQPETGQARGTASFVY